MPFITVQQTDLANLWILVDDYLGRGTRLNAAAARTRHTPRADDGTRQQAKYLQHSINIPASFDWWLVCRRAATPLTGACYNIAALLPPRTATFPHARLAWAARHLPRAFAACRAPPRAARAFALHHHASPGTAALRLARCWRDSGLLVGATAGGLRLHLPHRLSAIFCGGTARRMTIPAGRAQADILVDTSLAASPLDAHLYYGWYTCLSAPLRHRTSPGDHACLPRSTFHATTARSRRQTSRLHCWRHTFCAHRRATGTHTAAARSACSMAARLQLVPPLPLYATLRAALRAPPAHTYLRTFPPTSTRAATHTPTSILRHRTHARRACPTLPYAKKNAALLPRLPLHAPPLTAAATFPPTPPPATSATARLPGTWFAAHSAIAPTRIF